MSKDIENIIKTTLENINNMTENEKLISSKISYENANFLAISKLNMNFVIGGSDIDKKYRNIDLKPFAGAAYVNLSLSPQFLIYENQNQIQSVNLNSTQNLGTDWSAILSNAISYIKDLKEKKSKNEKTEKTEKFE